MEQCITFAGSRLLHIFGWCRLVTFRLRFDSHCRHLQATMSKLLTYYVLRPTQPLTLCGTENE